jgi:phosphate transport system substrate-binding protein
MTKRTSAIMGGMAAAVALATAATAGAATTPLYGGGSTLVEKVYRDLFDAYGNTAAGDLCAGLSTTCPTTHYNSSVELLYVGVGSGNGLKALDAHDASLYVTGNKKPDGTPTPSGRDFGAFYGTGTGKSWLPGTGVGPNYPKVSFSASDNTLSSTDVTAVAALGFGPVIQIPGIIAAIAVPFHPTANWNPSGVKPTGGSSKVQLSTNTLCGIFTGAITDWSNAEIKKDNNNVQLGSGKITVVYRNDSSGTTFLFSNALLAQCGTQARRVPHATHPVPNQWIADNKLAGTYSATLPHFKSNTSFFINVFNAGHLPANFYNDKATTGVSGGVGGSGGVKTAIKNVVGAIGYVSPDFVQPVDLAGAQAANLQTYYSFSHGTTPVYKAPTPANATLIMNTAVPPAFTGSPSAASNPLKWGAVQPSPTNTQAYPIGGFSFIDLYTCYKSATDVTALVGTTAGKLGYLTWYYGSKTQNGGVPASTLAADGFAPVPAAWATAINTLLTDAKLGVSTAGLKSCAAIKTGA